MYLLNRYLSGSRIKKRRRAINGDTIFGGLMHLCVTLLNDDREGGPPEDSARRGFPGLDDSAFV